MTGKLQQAGANGETQVLEDAYLAWLEAAIESEHALHLWFDADSHDRSSLYIAYGAALDREEAAASDLERLSRLAHRDGGEPALNESSGHRFAVPIVHEVPRPGVDGR